MKLTPEQIEEIAEEVSQNLSKHYGIYELGCLTVRSGLRVEITKWECGGECAWGQTPPPRSICINWSDPNATQDDIVETESFMKNEMELSLGERLSDMTMYMKNGLPPRRMIRYGYAGDGQSERPKRTRKKRS